MNAVSEKFIHVLPLIVMLLAGPFSGGWGASLQSSHAPDSTGVVVQISMESAEVTAGGWLAFHTELRNGGESATPPLVAHLSIAVVDEWRHVDPEDWSPERTQFLPSLAPGESTRLDWEIHALFEGVFASFVTVMSEAPSFQPVTSAPLRLQVAPDSILPMEDVLPVVAVVPLFPLALLVIVIAYTRRRRAAP